MKAEQLGFILNLAVVSKILAIISTIYTQKEITYDMKGSDSLPCEVWFKISGGDRR